MALAFVLFVVATSIGGQVLAGIQTSQFTTANNASCTYALAQAGQANCMTAAYNVTGYGLTGVLNLGNSSGTIGTVIGAAILIGIILTAFYMGSRQ